MRDHCHYTGEFRGEAHRDCNLRYRVPSFIPVVFHNMSRYDAHLFIKELAKHTIEDMNVIAKSKENYISFSAHIPVREYLGKVKTIELRFIDSFKFMASSLDSLTNNLVSGGKRLFDLSDDPEEYSLLTRKGVYPYEYMDSWERFNEMCLPPIEKFYSKLNGLGISEDDYKHAEKIWKEFNIQNLGQYHDLYLRRDVILLANVFEEFRNTCIKHYGLDPANFYTSPGLAWKACFKKTRKELELLKDPDMLMMFNRGIRGGITQSIHRYAEANNKYMDKFNSNLSSSYIQDLDTNNLHGWAMSQPLPTGGFKWVDIEINWVREPAKRDAIGYLLEVDVKYPNNIHKSHDELPFMSEKMEINGVTKLVPNLHDKSKYVIHIRALAQVIKHGLILERIHRAIEFKQSAWMKPYIDFNTQLRSEAMNDSEKDFFNPKQAGLFRI